MNDQKQKWSLLSLDEEEAILPLFVISRVVYYGRLVLEKGSYAKESLMRLRMGP